MLSMYKTVGKVITVFVVGCVFVVTPLQATAADKEGFAELETIQEQFELVDFLEFYNRNQIPERMVQKKQRVMLPPSAVQFNAQLMSAPKPGDFSLVYDALGLWQRVDETSQNIGSADQPNVTHSAFIGAANGPVLGMYLSAAAAKQLQQFEVNDSLRLYAVHIYNYSGGPRLVVLGAEPTH